MRARATSIRLALVSAFVVSLALFTGGSATLAITNGQPDATSHPYVGLMVAYDADGNPLWRCSGALLSASLYLTAAHCTGVPAAHVEVWLDSGYPTEIPFAPAFPAAGSNACAGIIGYPCTGDAGGTPHPNPDHNVGNPFGGGQGLPAFEYRDVGVVVLEAPGVAVSRYATLPSAGLVGSLENKAAVDLVGYGATEQAKIPGALLPQPPPFYRWTGPLTRMYAPSQLVSGEFVHSDEFIRMSLNPSHGSGGVCFGDSGGPDLRGGSDVVLAVNSYLQTSCTGVAYAQRVDVPGVLAWISSFL